MGGWVKTWPSDFTSKLKGLGLTDADITNLKNTKNLAATKALADPMIKKHADKAAAIKKALETSFPGLKW